MRYRGGKRRGYASRLHYFSEWISDGAQRGLVADRGDLTLRSAEVAGEPVGHAALVRLRVGHIEVVGLRPRHRDVVADARRILDAARGLAPSKHASGETNGAPAVNGTSTGAPGGR